MGHHYAGALGFADDLILLCPSLYGIRRMLEICENFAAEYDLIFNGAKSKLLIFDKENMVENDPKLKLNGELIPNVESADHLGNILHVKNNQECIDAGIRKFNSQVNMFLARFKTCTPSIRNELFQQYCSSLYGCQLWPLWSKKMVGVTTKWCIAMRRVWSISWRTHRDLLPLISGMQPIELSIQSRILKFVKSLHNSENDLVKYIVKYATTAKSSILGRNVRILCTRTNKSHEDILKLTEPKMKKIINEKWTEKINNGYTTRANVIKKLLLTKENIWLEKVDRIASDTVIDILCVL